MTLEDCVRNVDDEYIVAVRRELHMRPEIGFDLPETLAKVKNELGKMGIPFSEEYGKSSLVADINGGCKNYTIGIRADMDALPIHETNDVPYRSQIPGRMHACGHDAHTAMLLGTAKALKAAEDRLACRVRLLFQACEEGELSGARLMVEDGVMDEIDIIIGLHVENWLESGSIGVCPGPSMAASHPIKIVFHGKAAHATLPQTGHDALAMAVKTYNGIQAMLAREIDPFARYVCSVGTLNAGKAVNIIADYAEMKLTLRTFDTDLEKCIVDRIKLLSANAAAELGGTSEVLDETKALPVINHPLLSSLVLQSAEKVLDKDRIVHMPVKMSSEDFSFYLGKKPGVFFRLGTRNEAKDCTTLPHNDNFMIDEDALGTGSRVCVQFVLDHMHGINLE